MDKPNPILRIKIKDYYNLSEEQQEKALREALRDLGDAIECRGDFSKFKQK